MFRCIRCLSRKFVVFDHRVRQIFIPLLITGVEMCRFILSVIPLLFVSAVKGENPFRADYVYNKKTDAYYKLHTETFSYEDAKDICRVEGGGLMLPSHLDIIQLHGMLKRFPDIGDLVWVANDGQEHESAEEPALIDFEPQTESSATPWARNCDVVTRKGEIEMARCAQRLPFICKVDSKTITYNSECDVYSKGFTKGENVSSCYKIPRTPYTWNQAYAECQAQGAHLVVLNSQAEHDAVYQIMNREAKVVGARTWWFFFAGFRAEIPSDGTPRVFKTIFNETLEQAGYSTWADNEPNNSSNDENCGSLFKNDGKLNDVACTHLYAFICEKEIIPK